MKNTQQLRNVTRIAIVGALAIAMVGCGASKMLHPRMKPLNLTGKKAKKKPTNPFKRDRIGGITEERLHKLLEAPVFLEGGARLGVVPVSTGYAVDRDLPLVSVPASVSTAVQEAGLFEVATEVTTDWPADRGVRGLRELAARYRCEYLLLYRHRFVDRQWTNGWAALYLTVIGAFMVPSHTLETAGVLEATLFDVKSGSLLFTVYERVVARSDENVWQNDRKRRQLKQGLLDTAAKKLAAQVVGKTRRLADARPAPAAPGKPRARNVGGL